MGGIQEIERRAIIGAKDKEKILARVHDMGAQPLGTKRISDIYFCSKEIKSYKEVAMHEVGDYGLRIRKETGEKGTKCMLNVKIITTKDNHSSWEEHEISIEDMDKMGAILQAIGFKPFFSYTKTRTSFKLGRIKVLFEDIDDFGLGIEAEIVSTKAKEDVALQELLDLFKKLGVKERQIVPLNTTITAIMMEKRSKF